MPLINHFLTEETKKILSDFLKPIANLYPVDILEKIKFFIETNYPFTCENYAMYELMAATEILPDEVNLYKKVLELLKKLYGMNKTFVDVGAGIYPILSSMIAELQRNLPQGKVIAYDPALIIECSDERKEFNAESLTLDTMISNPDVYIGMKNCHGALLVIDKVWKDYSENGIVSDMFLVPCTDDIVPQDSILAQQSGKRVLWPDYVWLYAQKFLIPGKELFKENVEKSYGYWPSLIYTLDKKQNKGSQN